MNASRTRAIPHRQHVMSLLLAACACIVGCQQIPVDIETYRADRGALDQAKRFAFAAPPQDKDDLALRTTLDRAMTNHAAYEVVRRGPARSSLDDAVYRQAVLDAARRSLESRGYTFDAAQPQFVIDLRAVSSPFVIAVPGDYRYHPFYDCGPFYRHHHHRVGFYYAEYDYRPPYEFQSQATVVEITVTAPGQSDEDSLLWRGTGSLVTEEGGAETLARYLVDAVLDEFPARSGLPVRRKVTWKKILAEAHALD